MRISYANRLGQGYTGEDTCSYRGRIYKYPEVQATYLISGGFDLLVFMEGKTLREISSFVYEKLSTMEFVMSTTTHFVLKKYKDHGIILNSKNEDERMIMTP